MSERDDIVKLIRGSAKNFRNLEASKEFDSRMCAGAVKALEFVGTAVENGEHLDADVQLEIAAVLSSN